MTTIAFSMLMVFRDSDPTLETENQLNRHYRGTEVLSHHIPSMRHVILFIVTLFSYLNSFPQEIAITFDDAPSGNGAILTAMERTSRIIETLKKHNVKQAAFFVITSQFETEGISRLKMYSEAGHLLANHSHSHNWIATMGTAGYIRDIEKADSILKTSALPYERWYRYPFLDEGGTRTSRDSIRAALTRLSLTNAYTTIDNWDWYFNRAVSNAVNAGTPINFNELRNVYLEHIWTSIQFYDNIGKKVLGRSPKHVLLLHENDLAALFLDDLIKLLKEKGWKIISPRDAYNDPIAREIPDVLFYDQGRIGAIAFSKGLNPSTLVQKSEDEKYLEQLMSDRRVFE